MADNNKTTANPQQEQTDLTASDNSLPQQAIPKGKMHVKIYAPFKTYFNGIADNLSAVNATGPFDILPEHHYFMALLSTGEIVVRNDGKEEKIKISRGVMHVKKDEVIVFLDV